MSEQVPTVAALRGTSKPRAVAGARANAKAKPISAACEEYIGTVGDQRSWGAARRAGQQCRRQREDQRWSIVTELIFPAPVTTAELDVIESHLGDVLDELLAIGPAA